MTKTYIQLVKQIESLQVEAEKLRKSEVEGVIKRIREAITHYGLTASDLGLGAAGAKTGTATAKKKPGRKPKASAAKLVKFRNEQGQTWGGRGKRPQWLRDALNAGKTLNDFLVK